MSRSKLQKGSMGDEVKELQTLLNDAGIKTDVDGLFSDWTNAAVMEYQYRNNLDANGIVDEKTWESLLGSADSDKSTTISAPNATAPKYDSTSFNDTAEGKNLWDAYDKAQQAVNAHGDFKYANQGQLDQIMQSILNRQPFSYDFNEDAFYQQYKDKYMQQGKLAMQDAMGQAAAMTGGYGNSYAQSVGQQAYQGHLQQLNDMIPELYQLALNKYNHEGQRLQDQYSMLRDDYEREYGVHSDKYDKLLDALSIAKGDYYDREALFRSEQDTKNNLIRQEFEDAMAILNYNADQEKNDDDVIDNGGDLIGAIPESVVSKAATFTDNKALEAYLESSEAAGIIDHEQALYLLSEYMDENEIYDEETGDISYKAMLGSSKGWSVIGDGGGNLFGIDRDAVVMAPNGEIISLNNLRKKLKAEGMNTSEANKLIKALMENLGI